MSEFLPSVIARETGNDEPEGHIDGGGDGEIDEHAILRDDRAQHRHHEGDGEERHHQT